MVWHWWSARWLFASWEQKRKSICWTKRSINIDANRRICSYQDQRRIIEEKKWRIKRGAYSEVLKPASQPLANEAEEEEEGTWMNEWKWPMYNYVEWCVCLQVFLFVIKLDQKVDFCFNKTKWSSPSSARLFVRSFIRLKGNVPWLVHSKLGWAESIGMGLRPIWNE